MNITTRRGSLTEFGNVFGELRYQARLTLGEIADAVHLTPAYLSGLARGHKKAPPIERIKQIADVLNIEDGLKMLLLAKDLDEFRERIIDVEIKDDDVEIKDDDQRAIVAFQRDYFAHRAPERILQELRKHYVQKCEESDDH